MTIDPNSLRATQTGVQPSSAEQAQQRRVEAQQRRVEAHYAKAPKPEGGSALADRSSDNAQISNLSRTLMRLNSDSPERAAHLERLSLDVQSKRYQVDPQVVSQRIIEETLRTSH